MSGELNYSLPILISLRTNFYMLANKLNILATTLVVQLHDNFRFFLFLYCIGIDTLKA